MFPVALSAAGKAQQMPMPHPNAPANAQRPFVVSTTSPMPTPATIAPARTIPAGPMCRCGRSAASRPAAMAVTKTV
jgi:hypothetical protein